MSFLAAAAFQWINPKAWIITLTAAAYTTLKGRMALQVVLLSLVFAVVGGASSAT